MIPSRITTKERATTGKGFWYVRNGATDHEVMNAGCTSTQSRMLTGRAATCVTQVYWRRESYNVRDIHMGTLNALIAWQLCCDATTRDRTSESAQWYVVG